MNILVTGGAGFIGSAVVDRLINEGHQVTIIDDLSTGKRSNINQRAKFCQLDIRDKTSLRDLFAKNNFTLINHHAAQIQVVKSTKEPILDYEINIQGTLNLLECCREFSVKKFIFASSGGAVYGEPKYLPVDENHSIFPESPYGISKSIAELHLKVYQRSFEINYTILRYGNVYGPRQDSKGEAGVIAIFIGKMLKGETPVIFGDGESIRDYIYVGDVVEANVLAMKRRESAIYNIGTGVGTSVNSIFAQLKKILSFQKKVIYDRPRAGELRKIYLKTSKAEKELDWQAKVKLGEGLKKTITFFQETKKTS
ncbi:MAG: UDP-glucose 4-epimerase [bacterium (Candidatus Ratteibacteria) CG_4_9_14_3_um_filter_41_21]|uniref:UDP-glucose 4-epimerase n=2 Tax=Candidatus Ratteibacteria TaxID=2979319 RepID=A0A2M7YFM0_9BACT|nr:MAG: UDP-glucose 4-epimerase [bacterium (Candidatus Ratteibacteria) CG01_land_8_20_14_3_00_40_19]PJA61758.1 MAG: UDP-glucose 4-epimerase [bacterium (Candidatus Ratteibacteria) CG_4_9_14_3_um_filter_41_21]HCG76699.1 UDP-glucose 4-epimerase [bacterium]